MIKTGKLGHPIHGHISVSIISQEEIKKSITRTLQIWISPLLNEAGSKKLKKQEERLWEQPEEGPQRGSREEDPQLHQRGGQEDQDQRHHHHQGPPVLSGQAEL